MNAENNTFGRQRLEGVLCEPTGSCLELLSTLVTKANQFAEGVEQFDDITLMALKRKI